MGKDVLQGGRFATEQESRFQAAKRLDMRSASFKKFGLLMLRNRVYRMRNADIWAELSSNEFDLLMVRICVFRLAKVHV